MSAKALDSPPRRAASRGSTLMADVQIYVIVLALSAVATAAVFWLWG